MKYFMILFFVLLQYSLPIAGNSVFAKENSSFCTIKTGDYTLDCGKYKGQETDYNHIKQAAFTKDVYANLSKKEITINGISTKYKIKKNKLYVDNRVMYEIIGNNKLLMLAGGGIVFEHE